MKNNYILSFMILTLLVSFQAMAQVNVTFRVDMSAETVSPMVSMLLDPLMVGHQTLICSHKRELQVSTQLQFN